MTRSAWLIAGIVLMFFSRSALAQQRSAKRGIGWDEQNLSLSTSVVEKMAPGIRWVYNWGVAPRNTEAGLGPDEAMDFLPMCWNGGFDETALRTYLSSHPGVPVLLGFNEPNFRTQANMTPQQAAEAWPRLESIADDYGMELAAPALNFTGEVVGGRAWSPYEWLNEFFRLYPTARVDYLTLHCYMNWYSSTLWFATEYFYKDLYDAAKTDVYGRYPHLVAYLDAYRAVNGHFPRMYLTEFCAWEGNKDGFILTAESQIDQMTQKVQKLEQNDLVAGYAWFMGNAAGGASSYPYMSLFLRNAADSPLSALGQVYVHMSSFDVTRRYAVGEVIPAKDYVDASTDNQQVRLRPTTDPGGASPLQVVWGASSWMGYQVNIPSAGDYLLTFRMNASADASFRLYRNTMSSANRLLNTTVLPSTGGEWGDVSMQVTLPAGQYTLLFYNMSTTPVLLSTVQLQTTSGIRSLRSGLGGADDDSYYTLDGAVVRPPLSMGVYIHRGVKMMIP